MRQSSLRRPAAWLALAAMAAALALPAHAMPSRAAMAVPGGDLCVGGKIVPVAPSGGAAHACDACCGSTASAPPRAQASDRPIPFAQLRSAIAGIVPSPTVVVRAPRARAPPA